MCILNSKRNYKCCWFCLISLFRFAKKLKHDKIKTTKKEIQKAKNARVNGLKQWQKLTMKMFRVKVHIRHNETLFFRYWCHNIFLPCTAAPSIASDTYHNSYHKRSISFPFVFLVTWTLSFLDWLSSRSFNEKINSGGDRLFSTFFSLLSFVDFLFIDRPASDLMIFSSYVIPQTVMRQEDHVASFELNK